MLGGNVKHRDKVYDRRAAIIPKHAEVITAIVDDPYGTVIGEKIAVTRAIRDDPLAGMLARKQINNAMYAAGRKWQQYHENSQIGGVGAIDPTKEAVDGGRMPDVLPTWQMEATNKLKAADAELGFNKGLVRAILGEPLSIQQYAMRLGLTTEREFKQIGWLFRQCLDALANLWGGTNRKSTQEELEKEFPD
jgi:hypothetical protein